MRLRRGDDGDRGEVGRERRPDAALDLRDLVAEVVDHAKLLVGRHAHGVVPHLQLDPELAEGRDDRDQVVRLDVLDRDLAARHRGERGEARDLDVLGADPVRAAAERGHADDLEDVRADAVDLRAQRDEEAAEVLDVRLAGGVADDRLALGEHGGHHRVLGRHHRSLVEEHPLAAQPVGAQVVAAVQLDLDAELGERVEVRVEAAAADHVSAGRRDGRAAEPREQRPGEKERRTDLTAELGIELRLARPRSCPRSPRSARVHEASAPSAARSSTIVSTSRIRGTFESDDRLGREHGRGEDRQRAVLVARGANAFPTAGARPRSRTTACGAVSYPAPWR